MKEIKIISLIEIFKKLIEKLEFENVTSIHVAEDLYNKIPTHQWSIYNNPNDIVVIGSLEDDIDNLLDLLNDSNRVTTYVDFDRFASLLRIISQIRNPIED
jgi:hypothetical protein